ncbi:hypothetical protein [Natrinema versiforme]|uniref:Uncharacterized protein n=1 Tax=Natrinema versiforme JCM 10478 TaxID=1227496 RepID=L9XRU7_9EURY|nr:hypothetical protein [Natrinema versiforme]ELY64499.1 hypothetical protein C489_17139 [Natrinema versiforme JCM 10478]
MDEPAAATDRPTEIRWERASDADRAEPIVERQPYVELALEHPDLEPTAYGDSFFPDAVPYAVEGTHRVCYWRPALEPGSSEPSEWSGVCATTDSLSPVTARASTDFDLVSRRDETTAVTVEGTVAGDSTQALVESYAVPDVRIRALSESRLEVLVDGSEIVVPAGTRRHVSLPERTVNRVDGEGGPTKTTPELRVRFPGERELHHPALGANYRLFPSFGLDLESVPSPLTVPTANGELDHEALAESLGVDLSARPYPERVLWQAFAYTAFDPHADSVPVLQQFPTGHLTLSGDPNRRC